MRSNTAAEGYYDQSNATEKKHASRIEFGLESKCDLEEKSKETTTTNDKNEKVFALDIDVMNTNNALDDKNDKNKFVFDHDEATNNEKNKNRKRKFRELGDDNDIDDWEWDKLKEPEHKRRKLVHINSNSAPNPNEGYNLFKMCLDSALTLFK
eukprot:351278_1